MRERHRLPRQHAGTGTTLISAATNGTPAIPVNGSYPRPSDVRRAVGHGDDITVVRILTSIDRADLLEGAPLGPAATAARGGRQLHPGARTRPPKAAGPDFNPPRASRRRARRVCRTTTRPAAEALGLHRQGPAGDETVRDRHVHRQRRQRSRDPARADHGPLEAIRPQAGSGTVDYAQGYRLDGEVVPSSATSLPAGTSVLRAASGRGLRVRRNNGWLRQQISTTIPALEPAGSCSGTCAPDRVDPTVDYTSGTTRFAGDTAWRFTTPLTVRRPRRLELVAAEGDRQEPELDELFVDRLTNTHADGVGRYGQAGGIGRSAGPLGRSPAGAKSHDGLALRQAAFTATFAAGGTPRPRPARLRRRHGPLSVRFESVPPDWQDRSIATAVAAGDHAKKVVIFAFDDGTEGVDRGGSDQNAGLELPGWQDALISAVAAVNKNVVVVLNTGDAVYMPWLSSVKSVLEMWYPGLDG